MVLRIAVPDRGVVADAARSLLDATGYGPSPASLLAAPALLGAPVKVFALPERDIPLYAAEGGLHLAVTGSLSVDEASVSVPVVLALDVGAHELALFSSEPRVRTEGDLHGARVATPLPNLVRRHLATATIAARRVVPLDPVEHAVTLGIADAVAAVVDPRADLSGPMRAMRRLGTVRTGHLVVVEGRAPRDDVTRLVKTQVLARLRAAGTATRDRPAPVRLPHRAGRADHRARRARPPARGPPAGAGVEHGAAVGRAGPDRGPRRAAARPRVP